MIEARKYSNALLKTAYDSRSWLYDKVVAPLERLCHVAAIKAAHITPGQKVLEVAVGPGNTFATLAHMAGPRTTLYGVDLSPGMLDFARVKMNAAGLEDFVLKQGNSRELPFASNYFDLLYNAYMFDLIPWAEMTAILLEFKRVLKSDGRVVLLNMSKKDDRPNLYEFLYKHLLSKLMLYLAGGCRPVMMASQVEAAGFSKVERVYLAGRHPSEIVTARKEVGLC